MKIKIQKGFVTAIVPIILIFLGVAGWIIFSKDSPKISQPTVTKEEAKPSPLAPTVQVDTEKIKKTITSASELDTVYNQLQLFLDQYKIRLYLKGVPSADYSTFSELTLEDLTNLKRFSNLFIDEWRKYPVDWVTNSNIKIIGFVKNLYVDGNYRAAVPTVYPSFGVYYDINTLGSYINPPGDSYYSNEVIHHEYYHLIEYNYFGSFYYFDNAWNAFNKPEFKYRGAGKDAYTSTEYRDQDHPQEGFVSTYSTYALEEDKAEVYSYLMVAGDYKNILEWVKSDPVLNKKVNYLKKFMQNHSKNIDENYFKRIGTN